MIVDFDIEGIFIPGLLVLAIAALAATITAIRLLSASGVFRLFAHRPIVEVAAFVIFYGLLAQYLPAIGLFP